jgi:hypothetical protein
MEMHVRLIGEQYGSSVGFMQCLRTNCRCVPAAACLQIAWQILFWVRHSDHWLHACISSYRRIARSKWLLNRPY